MYLTTAGTVLRRNSRRFFYFCQLALREFQRDNHLEQEIRISLHRNIIQRNKATLSLSLLRRSSWKSLRARQVGREWSARSEFLNANKLLNSYCYTSSPASSVASSRRNFSRDRGWKFPRIRLAAQFPRVVQKSWERRIKQPCGRNGSTPVVFR